MMSLKACIIYIFVVILKYIGRMRVTGINCSNIDLNDKICHDTKILLGCINFVNDQQRVFHTGNVYGESDVDSADEGIA